MSECIITYRSFHPLEISIACDEKEFYTGEIKVRITDVEIKVLDLSMGIPSMKGAGAYAMSDMQIATMVVDNVEMVKLYELFVMAADQFEEVSKIVRKVFVGKALLGSD